MLTDTQRSWAQAQVGEERVTTVTGYITKTIPSDKEDAQIFEVQGEFGVARFDVKASPALIQKMKQEPITVRLEGDVTGVQYDDVNDRVGLEISGEDGSTVEWVVPEISDEERNALSLAQHQKEQEEELEKENAEREEQEFWFKESFLIFLRTNEEVRQIVEGFFAQDAPPPTGG